MGLHAGAGADDGLLTMNGQFSKSSEPKKVFPVQKVTNKLGPFDRGPEYSFRVCTHTGRGLAARVTQRAS